MPQAPTKPTIFIMNEDGSFSLQLEIDVWITESHEFVSEATEHSVERGVNITDHIHRKPDKVSMSIFVSNEPISTPNTPLTAIALKLPGDTPSTISVAGVTVPIPALHNKPSLLTLLTPGGLSGALAGLVTDAVGGLLNPPVALGSTVYIPVGFDRVRVILDQLEVCRGQLLRVFTRKRDYENMALVEVKMDRGQRDGNGARIDLTFREIRVVNTQVVKAPALAHPAAKAKANKGAQPAPKRSANGLSSILSDIKGFFRGGA